MKEGDVALSPLPQADGQIKNRPVILLRRLPGFSDWLVCGTAHSFTNRLPVSTKLLKNRTLTTAEAD